MSLPTTRTPGVGGHSRGPDVPRPGLPPAPGHPFCPVLAALVFAIAPLGAPPQQAPPAPKGTAAKKQKAEDAAARAKGAADAVAAAREALDRARGEQEQADQDAAAAEADYRASAAKDAAARAEQARAAADKASALAKEAEEEATAAAQAAEVAAARVKERPGKAPAAVAKDGRRSPEKAPPAAADDDSRPAGKGADAPATMVFYVPPDSKVEINDRPTTQGGSVRTFETPPLPAGKSHTYHVTVSYPQPGGTTRESRRNVSVRAGEKTTEDFRD